MSEYLNFPGKELNVIKPSKYQEILKSKITNNYKIDYNNTIEQIDKDTSNFASRLQIEDRLGKFKKKEGYILFKDHKPNFENKLIKKSPPTFFFVYSIFFYLKDLKKSC